MTFSGNYQNRAYLLKSDNSGGPYKHSRLQQVTTVTYKLKLQLISVFSTTIYTLQSGRSLSRQDFSSIKASNSARNNEIEKTQHFLTKQKLFLGVTSSNICVYVQVFFRKDGQVYNKTTYFDIFGKALIFLPFSPSNSPDYYAIIR